MDICPFSKKPCPNPKNVHIKQNVNGEISEWNCCQVCANQLIPSVQVLMPMLPGFVAMPLPVVPLIPTNNLFSNLQKLELMERQTELPPEPRCDGCGATLTDIQSVGRFGCDKCYQCFREQIDCLLPQCQSGATRHVGKRPKCSIETLKAEMQKAVDDERYEDAAKFRDRIKELEKRVQGDNLKTPS